jgi:hypothetical protein
VQSAKTRDKDLKTHGDLDQQAQHFQVDGAIKDIERLKALFDLFAAVLDRLCKIGSAYKQAPGVEL